MAGLSKAGLSNTTRHGLSNTQAAYRFYNDRFMTGLQSRAQSLWNDGYRVAPLEDDDAPTTKFLVYKDDAENLPEDEAAYMVDPLSETCTCAFFVNQKVEPLREDEGRVPCKHLMGLDTLVKEEIAYWNMKATYTADYRREIEYVKLIRELTETVKRIGK